LTGPSSDHIIADTDADRYEDDLGFKPILPTSSLARQLFTNDITAGITNASSLDTNKDAPTPVPSKRRPPASTAPSSTTPSSTGPSESKAAPKGTAFSSLKHEINLFGSIF
jgi:hypothetical protein